jgi:hypothetical protein
MKVIYVEGAFGEPYRIEVSDALLEEVVKAQRALRMLPWNGEMFLPVPTYPLGRDKQLSAEIVVGKRSVSICIDGPEGRETMLNYPDDLLTIEDTYLSKEFENDLVENMFTLSLRDIDLIETWKEIKLKKLEDS